MATKTIYEENTIQFGDTGVTGLYLGMFDTVVPLAEGQEYILVWNGTEYECTAAAASFNGVDGVGIGNFALAGLGEDTGEPFLLGTATDGSMTVCYSTASGSNTISVYLVEEDAPTVTDTLVLLDNQGIEQHLTGVKGLKVLTTGGAEQTFIAGEAVEKTVNLDFSSGENMVVVPNTGKFFEKVTIIKPSSLVESNIAKDVDVAGIIGTHEGGDNETARIEYTYDESGNIIRASFVNMTKVYDYAFYNNTTLAEVDFSRSPNLTDIGKYAFSSCSKLTSIHLPSSLKKIEASAFDSTSAMRSVYFEGSLEDWISMEISSSPVSNAKAELYIGGEEITGSLVIPEGITTIGAYTFYRTAITDVTIPDSVTTIGKYAFAYTSLQSITIPDSVTTIGKYAFSGIASCTALVVGSGVTTMEFTVFASQTKLASVTLKEGVREIGKQCFQNCSALKTINIPASIKAIGNNAFYSAGITSATFADTSGWYVTQTEGATSGTNITPSNATTAATWLKSTYRSYWWYDNT